MKTTKIMSRSGLGNEYEFPPRFDKLYESPPQPHLLGSQSNFPLNHSSLSFGHLNYLPGIISYSDVPFFSTATLPSTSTNTSKKRRGRPYGSRNKKSCMNIVYGFVSVSINKSEQKRYDGVKGSFASLSNGRSFGGKIDGVLIAASPVQIILGSFFLRVKK
ncbi:unnamed protein product [Vicia faba]|uniref:Uncharacterized protein n=1 Tax=Vicia faba TaxID=3906 RepID=A0AAV0ZTC0_VICFA|nr:unnamed protein product [Vicia faba]